MMAHYKLKVAVTGLLDVEGTALNQDVIYVEFHNVFAIGQNEYIVILISKRLIPGCPAADIEIGDDAQRLIFIAVSINLPDQLFGSLARINIFHRKPFFSIRNNGVCSND